MQNISQYSQTWYITIIVHSIQFSNTQKDQTITSSNEVLFAGCEFQLLHHGTCCSSQHFNEQRTSTCYKQNNQEQNKNRTLCIWCENGQSKEELQQQSKPNQIEHTPTFADEYFCLTHLLLLPLIFRTTYSESTSSGGAQLPLFRSMVDAGR